MQYRQEIDGLRALAVLPVILYHAGVPGFPGGFAGVDIFFVISGFLITGILLNELQQERFSLAHFYERRARRILPALFIVLALTVPLAWWLLLPHELADFGESLIAVALFVSNFLFWQQSDYFAPTAEFIPLLHTWSLAVEEQFYLFFPLLLWLGWRLGRGKLMLIVLAVALLSLGLSEWLWRVSQSANFYLIFSRAWELMLGALAAFYLQQRPQPSGWLSEIGAAVGLLLVAGSVVLLHRGLPFPSLYALPPIVGSVLIIVCATPHNWTGRLLAFKPLVWIGLISYSAYLWHQPLLVFSRIYIGSELSVVWIVLNIVLTLVLAGLSWRFVEQPFRQRQRFSRPQIFSFAAVGSAFFILLGLVFWWGEGWPSRFM